MASNTGKIKLNVKKTRVASMEADYYVTRPVRYSTIPADKVVEYASKNNSIPKSYIQTACDALAREFSNFIMNGHSVKVGNIGTFSLSTKCKSANPAKGQTAADVVITGAYIRLRPSMKLKELLNRVTFETEIVKEEEEEA